MARESAALADTLVALTTEGPPVKVPPESGHADWDALVDLARDHRVSGAVLAGSPYLHDRLGERVRIDVMHHLATRAALADVGQLLDRAGVPWVVVKGPVLAELSYISMGRPYLDLDVVVAASAFGDAVAELATGGFDIIDRNWTLACRQRRGQLHLTSVDGTISLDLHWHLVNSSRHRERWAIPMAELLERRSRDPRVGGTILDPTDRTIHYAVHAALSGGHRLGWIKDVERTLVNDPPDWADLLDRCRRWRVGLAVAAMLERSRHTLGAPVPDGVIDALAGIHAHRLLVRSLRTWRPEGRLPGGGSLDRAANRSLVDTVPATMTGLAGEAVEMVARLIHPHPYWQDPTDARHMRYAAGGSEQRAAYFALVRDADGLGHRP